MNTLWGDPRIEKELPLVEGAAKVGADVFCIDARVVRQRGRRLVGHGG